MPESTVTTQGRITIPLQIRKSLGTVPGTRLVWNVMPSGSVIVRAKVRSIFNSGVSLKAR